MKIAVIGDGQLGTYVFNNFSKLYKTKMYALTNGFDITNESDIDEIVCNNDVIINCAALTNVDRCELSQDLSRQINCDAVGNLTKLCKQYDKILIHISTDFVYGSNNINDDLTEYEYFMNNPLESKPINAYGYHKLLADEKIESVKLSKYLIIRPSWVVGKLNPNNFFEKIKNKILTEEELLVVDDQFGVPTSVELIYDVIYDFLIGKIPSGLYNLRNEIDDKIPSRYDIACYIKQVLNSNCNILSISSDVFKSPAKRQLNSFLNINKIKQYYPHKFPTWKNVVDNYFK